MIDIFLITNLSFYLIILCMSTLCLIKRSSIRSFIFFYASLFYLVKLGIYLNNSSEGILVYNLMLETFFEINIIIFVLVLLIFIWRYNK